MKINTTTIINGRVLGQDSVTIKSRSDYDNYINGLMGYITDKELAIKSSHGAFSTTESDINEKHISTFSSDRFNSIIMDKCIAWEESGVITICSLDGEIPFNIVSLSDAEIML